MSPVLQPIGTLIDRDDVLRQIKHEFSMADPLYDLRRSALWGRLTPLADQVDKLQAQGHSVDCSQQHRLEAQWLLNYTADWTRAEATLKALETSLANHDQPPLAQDSGGSWGPCCSEPYRKLEPTVGELQDPKLGNGVTLQPLAFMAKYQDMDWLVANLERLQVSDIRQTQRNNRDELGSLQDSLAQLFFKSAISTALNARNPDGSPLDAFYDAVCFLGQIGFFYPNPSRFWTTADPIPVPAGKPTPSELCRKLKAGYQSMNPTGSDADKVFGILNDAIAHTTPAV